MEKQNILSKLEKLIKPKQINFSDYTKSLFACPICFFYYTYDSFEPGIPIDINEWENFKQNKSSYRYDYIEEYASGIPNTTIGWSKKMFSEQPPQRSFEQWLTLIEDKKFPCCRLCSNNGSNNYQSDINPNL
jgi:hypothetical protein